MNSQIPNFLKKRLAKPREFQFQFVKPTTFACRQTKLNLSVIGPYRTAFHSFGDSGCHVLSWLIDDHDHGAREAERLLRSFYKDQAFDCSVNHRVESLVDREFSFNDVVGKSRGSLTDQIALIDHRVKIFEARHQFLGHLWGRLDFHFQCYFVDDCLCPFFNGCEILAWKFSFQLLNSIGKKKHSRSPGKKFWFGSHQQDKAFETHAFVEGRMFDIDAILKQSDSPVSLRAEFAPLGVGNGDDRFELSCTIGLPFFDQLVDQLPVIFFILSGKYRGRPNKDSVFQCVGLFHPSTMITLAFLASARTRQLLHAIPLQSIEPKSLGPAKLKASGPSACVVRRAAVSTPMHA
jgi:hypothetical protein